MSVEIIHQLDGGRTTHACWHFTKSTRKYDGENERLLLNIILFFLNLPIWANFVDPTDLSLYYYDHFRPNQFYRMDSTSSSTSTRPSQAALVEAEVEVEAQPTRLGRLRLRLRLRHSLPG